MNFSKKCVDKCEDKCVTTKGQDCKEVPISWTECKGKNSMERGFLGIALRAASRLSLDI